MGHELSLHLSDHAWMAQALQALARQAKLSLLGQLPCSHKPCSLSMSVGHNKMHMLHFTWNLVCSCQLDKNTCALTALSRNGSSMASGALTHSSKMLAGNLAYHEDRTTQSVYLVRATTLLNVHQMLSL